MSRETAVETIHAIMGWAECLCPGLPQFAA